MLTEKQAKHLYDLGKQAKADGKDLHREISDMAGSWHEYKAFELGYKGVAWDVREYQRYGNVPDGPSYNYMDQAPEKGVSTANDEWRKTIHGMFFVAKNSHRKIVTFRGVFTGHYGGDDEPLVLPVE